MTPRRTWILAGVAFAAALLVVGIFIVRGYYSTLPLVLAAATGCGAYLLIGRREAEAVREPVISPLARQRWMRLLPSLFFLASAISVAVMYQAWYTRPLLYYGAVSVGAAALAALVFLVETRRETFAVLGMIVLLALNLFGSNLLAFPLGIGGADAPTHIHFLVLPIVQTGVIHQGDLCGLIYGAFPASHVLVAMTAIVIPADATLTYYGLGSAVMVLPVVVAYLIANRLFGLRVGLLAALLLSGSSYYISWAAHVAPLTYAIPLIALLFLVLAKSLESSVFRWTLPVATIGLALVLTHPYSSVIFGFLLLTIIVGQAIFRPGRRRSVGLIPSAGALYGFVLLFDWVNFSCLMTKSFQLARGWGEVFGGESLASPPAVYDALPLSAIAANTSGDVLLLIFAAMGFFVILSRQRAPRDLLVLGPMVALLILSGVGLLTTLAYILPNRVYVYLQFLALGPLAAMGIARVLRPSRATQARARRRGTPAIAALLIGGFVFASSTSTIAGFETSPFSGDFPYVKLYDTVFEERSADWICEFTPEPPPRIRLSPSYHGLPKNRIAACFDYNASVERMSVTENSTLDISRLREGDLVLFSHYDFDPGFQTEITGAGQFGRGVFDRLDPEELTRLDGFTRVYDNGRIQGFYAG